MPKFHAITFNAQAHAVEDAIPGMLGAPEQLQAMVHGETGAAAEAALDDGRREQVRAAAEWSMETAARSHLQTLLENQESEPLARITSPDRPQLVPDLQLESSRNQPLTGTHTVSFQQTARSIPIFGTRATVEIDGNSRKLISVDGSLADVPELSPIAQLSPAAATEALARAGGAKPAAITPTEAPLLNYYLEDREGEGKWRLVYEFRNVPMAPPATGEQAGPAPEPAPSMHCCGGAGPWSTPHFHYLVDANTGEVVLSYTAAPHLDVPVQCQGKDLLGELQIFYGLPGQNVVRMVDPLRGITTYDLKFADIDSGTAFPTDPVQSPTIDFGDSAPAAVSAHVYAMQVFDFYNTVLKRQGVDDKGMKLESVVNCYSSYENPDPSPVWRNAAWWNNRMWYGQMPGGNGPDPVSTARFFDVIAHELTHGITQYTADLAYINVSGALNESFSDIFGVIVKNWYPGQPNPLDDWTWTIGAGWNPDGSELRDLKNPTRGLPIWPKGRGQPAYWKDYVTTTADSGGVHINSGIHNHAAYLVLTAKDDNKNYIFRPDEVAILYYLTLTRLGKLATFSDCRRTLLNVATTYYTGNPAQQQKLQAIADAYDEVGIV